MNNDITELLKFIELYNYDIDKNKTTIYVDSSTSEITCHLFLNRQIIGCTYCKSTHTIIKDTIIKNINHCIKPGQKITVLFHQRKLKCKDCSHVFMEYNPIGESISFIGEIAMINMLRNPSKTFSDVAIDCFTSTQNVINHFNKRVDLKRHNLSKIVCFDEFYTKKLTATKYAFSIFNPIKSEIIDILDARRRGILC